jgi:CRP-like cAMP-binding protein
MKKISIKKGTLLQHKGDVNTMVYEVESGLLRSFSIDAKGKEHVFLFAPEGWIVADAIAPEEASELFIEAIEDSIVIVKERDVYSVDPIVLAKRISVLQNRVIRLMSASAIERYEAFLKTYPDIVQRVPQKMIASFLGITPEALSKAKGDKMRSSIKGI